jgi:UDPglucose 6-dehydrogenase
MVKPAFIFDGRNILDRNEMKDIGFIFYGLGKPLDPFVAETLRHH